MNNQSRVENLLATLLSGETTNVVPQSRIEKILLDIVNGETDDTFTPRSRIEAYLKAISENGSGGGGDEASVLDSLIDGSITEITSNATTILPRTFHNRQTLTSAKFPLVKNIGNESFYNCTALKSINAPIVETIGDSGFNNCKALISVNFPLATKINPQTFYGCESLETANIPANKYIYESLFYNCKKLTTVNLASAIYFASYVFRYCESLKTVILRSETLATLNATNSFERTLIASGAGYIYVPRALVDTYKSATNWSTYATQFRALEDYTVDGTITGELDETKI